MTEKDTVCFLNQNNNSENIPKSINIIISQ